MLSVPGAKKRKRDGAATREKILAEALVLFAEKGFDATSVKDISSAVGVADAALYRHFPSKEELAHAVFKRHYSALAGQIAEIGNSHGAIGPIMDGLVELLCRTFDDEPNAFTFILINQHNHLRFVGLSDNPVEEVATIMRKAIANGEIAIDDPDLAAAIALGVAIQPAIFHLYGRLHGKLADIRHHITEAVYRALGIRSGQSLPGRHITPESN